MRIIAGKFKNRALVVPSQARPTLGILREALFNICQHEIVGAHVLDLFAGSGAIGFEALSRGAAHVTFVENHREALKALHQNIATLDVTTQTKVYGYDVKKAIELLQKHGEQFDLIYVDPPYGKQLGAQTLHQLDASSLLKENGTLYLEENVETSLSLAHLKLKNTRTVGATILQEYILNTSGDA